MLTDKEESVAEFQNSQGVVFALTDLGGQNHMLQRQGEEYHTEGTVPPPHGLNIARASLVIEGMWLASI